MRRVLAAGAALLVAPSFVASAPARAVVVGSIGAARTDALLAYVDFGGTAEDGKLVVVSRSGPTSVPSAVAGFTYTSVEFSPDGRQLAFVAGPLAGPSSLYVVPVDGSAAPRQVADAAVGKPVWSPDGTRLAYTRNARDPGSDGRGELHVVGADGTGDRSLAAPASTPFADTAECGPMTGGLLVPLDWTPDASAVLVSYRNTCFEIDIASVGYVGVADGRAVVLGPGETADLSPDGTEIAIGGPEGLAIGSAFGAAPPVLGLGTQPTWSPDGSRVTFVRGTQIWEADQRGRGTPTLYSPGIYAPPGSDTPKFLPDETGIAFMTNDRTERKVVVVDRASGGVVQYSAPRDFVVDYDFAPGTEVRRLAGGSRYETAVAIADAMFPAGAFDAVLARGDDFADAMVAAGLASSFNGGAPILLTPRDALPGSVADALDRLGTQRVAIIGGPDVVSPAVEAAVRARVHDVYRLAGGDRFETARLVAGYAPDLGGRAVVASGERFADALAAGPLANRTSAHTFLTRSDSLPSATVTAIQERGVHDVVIVGGTAVVSAAVEAALRAVPGVTSVSRVAGTTRSDTAALLADRYATPITEVTLARGDTFPDAVAGAPIGGERNAPTLFTDGPDQLTDATRAWLRAHAGQITTLRILGDTEAVSDAVVAEALAILNA